MKFRAWQGIRVVKNGSIKAAIINTEMWTVLDQAEVGQMSMTTEVKSRELPGSMTDIPTPPMFIYHSCT